MAEPNLQVAYVLIEGSKVTIVHLYLIQVKEALKILSFLDDNRGLPPFVLGNQ